MKEKSGFKNTVNDAATTKIICNGKEITHVGAYNHAPDNTIAKKPRTGSPQAPGKKEEVTTNADKT